MALEPNLHARLPDEYDPDRIDQLFAIVEKFRVAPKTQRTELA